MKLSKRIKHFRRGRHTKRSGKHTRRKYRGKQYKRTYRKNSRKLKNNKRIQRGGWEWENVANDQNIKFAKNVLLEYKKLSEKFGSVETKPFNITLESKPIDDNNVKSFTITMDRQTTNRAKKFILYFKLHYLNTDQIHVQFSTTLDFKLSDGIDYFKSNKITICPSGEPKEPYEFTAGLDSFLKLFLPMKMKGMVLEEHTKKLEEQEKQFWDEHRIRFNAKRDAAKAVEAKANADANPNPNVDTNAPVDTDADASAMENNQ